MRLKNVIMMSFLLMAVFLTGCGVEQDVSRKAPAVTVRLAAASSLEKVFSTRIIPLFNKKHPEIRIEGVYDGSGKLQVQIENGLAADLFIPASERQMDALQSKGYLQTGSVKPLLENRLVLIVPAGRNSKFADFAQMALAKQPAIGDPQSVPAGFYAKEVLQKLGLWERVYSKASLGSNVTQVLYWVAEGSADAGIVYATDARLQQDKLRIVAEAPAEAMEDKVLYPLGMLKNAPHPTEARLFAEFLRSREAMKIFEEYGFTGVEDNEAN